ncbi:MAG: MGMT family protein [Clostridiales bacterium]|nr:MGMT family protein [Clostridiales bacterium]
MGFFESVYEKVKQIPYGKVASYGQVARSLGSPKMARQVGWALHVNPYFGKVPCHRVVTKDGRVANNFAFGGGKCQISMLKSEGIEFDDTLCVLPKFFVDKL